MSSSRIEDQVKSRYKALQGIPASLRTEYVMAAASVDRQQAISPHCSHASSYLHPQIRRLYLENCTCTFSTANASWYVYFSTDNAGYSGVKRSDALVHFLRFLTTESIPTPGTTHIKVYTGCLAIIANMLSIACCTLRGIQLLTLVIPAALQYKPNPSDEPQCTTAQAQLLKHVAQLCIAAVQQGRASSQHAETAAFLKCAALLLLGRGWRDKPGSPLERPELLQLALQLAVLAHKVAQQISPEEISPSMQALLASSQASALPSTVPAIQAQILSSVLSGAAGVVQSAGPAWAPDDASVTSIVELTSTCGAALASVARSADVGFDAVRAAHIAHISLCDALAARVPTPQGAAAAACALLEGWLLKALTQAQVLAAAEEQAVVGAEVTSPDEKSMLSTLRAAIQAAEQATKAVPDDARLLASKLLRCAQHAHRLLVFWEERAIVGCGFLPIASYLAWIAQAVCLVKQRAPTPSGPAAGTPAHWATPGAGHISTSVTPALSTRAVRAEHQWAAGLATALKPSTRSAAITPIATPSAVASTPARTPARAATSRRKAPAFARHAAMDEPDNLPWHAWFGPQLASELASVFEGSPDAQLPELQAAGKCDMLKYVETLFAALLGTCRSWLGSQPTTRHACAVSSLLCAADIGAPGLDSGLPLPSAVAQGDVRQLFVCQADACLGAAVARMVRLKAKAASDAAQGQAVTSANLPALAKSLKYIVQGAFAGAAAGGNTGMDCIASLGGLAHNMGVAAAQPDIQRACIAASTALWETALATWLSAAQQGRPVPQLTAAFVQGKLADRYRALADRCDSEAASAVLQQSLVWSAAQWVHSQARVAGSPKPGTSSPEQRRGLRFEGMSSDSEDDHVATLPFQAAHAALMQGAESLLAKSAVLDMGGAAASLARLCAGPDMDGARQAVQQVWLLAIARAQVRSASRALEQGRALPALQPRFAALASSAPAQAQLEHALLQLHADALCASAVDSSTPKDAAAEASAAYDTPAFVLPAGQATVLGISRVCSSTADTTATARLLDEALRQLQACPDSIPDNVADIALPAVLACATQARKSAQALLQALVARQARAVLQSMRKHISAAGSARLAGLHAGKELPRVEKLWQTLCAHGQAAPVIFTLLAMLHWAPLLAAVPGLLLQAWDALHAACDSPLVRSEAVLEAWHAMLTAWRALDTAAAAMQALASTSRMSGDQPAPPEAALAMIQVLDTGAEASALATSITKGSVAISLCARHGKLALLQDEAWQTSLHSQAHTCLLLAASALQQLAGCMDVPELSDEVRALLNVSQWSAAMAEAHDMAAQAVRAWPMLPEVHQERAQAAVRQCAARRLALPEPLEHSLAGMVLYTGTWHVTSVQAACAWPAMAKRLLRADDAADGMSQRITARVLFDDDSAAAAEQPELRATAAGSRAGSAAPSADVHAAAHEASALQWLVCEAQAAHAADHWLAASALTASQAGCSADGVTFALSAALCNALLARAAAVADGAGAQAHKLAQQCAALQARLGPVVGPHAAMGTPFAAKDLLDAAPDGSLCVWLQQQWLCARAGTATLETRSAVAAATLVAAHLQPASGTFLRASAGYILPAAARVLAMHAWSAVQSLALPAEYAAALRGASVGAQVVAAAGLHAERDWAWATHIRTHAPAAVQLFDATHACAGQACPIAAWCSRCCQQGRAASWMLHALPAADGSAVYLARADSPGSWHVERVSYEAAWYAEVEACLAEARAQLKSGAALLQADRATRQRWWTERDALDARLGAACEAACDEVREVVAQLCEAAAMDAGAGDTSTAPAGGWAKLLVAELRAELKACGLPTTGRKAELVARLEAAEPVSMPGFALVSPACMGLVPWESIIGAAMAVPFTRGVAAGMVYAARGQPSSQLSTGASLCTLSSEGDAWLAACHRAPVPPGEARLRALVDPDGTLAGTQERVGKALASHGWEGNIGPLAPDAAMAIAREADVLLVAAHGAAQGVLPTQRVAEAGPCIPRVALLGCSSGRCRGKQRSYDMAPVHAWLHAGCRQVVACLWDVGDQDADAVALRMMPALRDEPGGSLPSMLKSALAASQLKSRWLNGAALVCFGAPL